MTVTDCNKNLNSKQQFQIEIDGEWFTVSAPDFFDYLYQTSRIDGHDPASETAWTEGTETHWNPARQDWEETHTGESHSYEWWLEEFVDNDEVLLGYMQTMFMAQAIAA